MGKRFTDTDIWTKPWYRKLSPAEKCAFTFLTASCDNVGVWIPDFELANFMIGQEIDWQDLIKKCNNNIEVLDNGKWWLPDFCAFQYGCLRRGSTLYKKLVSLLIHHGLKETTLLSRPPRLFDFMTDRIERHYGIKKYQELRTAIFLHDDYTCYYCRKRGGSLEIDHKIPLSRGGTNKLDNLVTACKNCNRRKHDKTVEEFLASEGKKR